MITKKNAINAHVDWNKVEKATEIRRTYQLMNMNGEPGIIFKMYKPSQLHLGKVFGRENISERYRGKLFLRMGKMDRSGQSHADKKPKDIFRERRIKEMLDEREQAYCY